jgi:uncharacterized iron-regulated protein
MEDMQPQSLRLERLAIDSLPIIDDFIERIKLARLLREKIRYESISEKRFQQFAFQKKPTIKVRNVGSNEVDEVILASYRSSYVELRF